MYYYKSCVIITNNMGSNDRDIDWNMEEDDMALMKPREEYVPKVTCGRPKVTCGRPKVTCGRKTVLNRFLNKMKIEIADTKLVKKIFYDEVNQLKFEDKKIVIIENKNFIPDQGLNLELDLEQDLELDLEQDSEQDLELDLEQDLEQDLEKDLEQDLEQELYPELYEEHDHNEMINLIKSTLSVQDQKDPMIVFKICQDYNNKTKYWFVILKKIVDESSNDNRKIEQSNIFTITNESRDNIFDPMYAKFRANVLLVIKIIDPIQKCTIGSIDSVYYTGLEYKKTSYTVGKMVHPDKYDYMIDIVRTNGIHFYKSIDAALCSLYRKNCFLGKIIGQIIFWYDDGAKESEKIFLDEYNHKSYTYTRWCKNSIIETEIEYLNGMKNGKWIEKYENGEKKSELYYEKGSLHDKSTYWHKNGKINAIENYNQGNKHGPWEEWYENGQKRSEKYFVNDFENGKCTYWYSNGRIESQGHYSNGFKNGQWINYYTNNTKKSFITFVDGIENGKYIFYLMDGTVIYEGYQKNTDIKEVVKIKKSHNILIKDK